MKKSIIELNKYETKVVSGGMLPVPIEIVAPVGVLLINAMVFLCKYLSEKNPMPVKPHSN